MVVGWTGDHYRHHHTHYRFPTVVATAASGTVPLSPSSSAAAAASGAGAGPVSSGFFASSCTTLPEVKKLMSRKLPEPKKLLLALGKTPDEDSSSKG